MRVDWMKLNRGLERGLAKSQGRYLVNLKRRQLESLKGMRLVVPKVSLVGMFTQQES